ncbi:protein rep [Corynebacterium tuberculostearicum]|uniref:protein rep n=1 Tax=Corynebacterium tuberculostearicum TaxID=38304 RepID=UPI002934FE43|nr:protein rep [Corynebacterium tuberculostearicum]MDV2433982.1 protein rep [Corynebacterium tuberculostearicum]
MHDGSRPAGYAGVERCSSIWACPHCAAVIRAGRAAEIEQAVKAHQKTAGEVLFFTGTVRHHRGDELATTLDAVLMGWKKMLQSRGWARLKKTYGLSGYVRAIEVTYGQNSWHPHVHALLFLDEGVPAECWDELRELLFGLWSDSVVKAGAKRPTEKGLDLRKLDGDGRVLSAYLAKVQDEKKKGRTGKGWGVGAEMSRSDVKSGRESSISPFELLDDDCAGYSGDERARLWREYYSATKGRRAITWSRGLKKRYDVGERTDEEVQDDAESTILVWRTHADVYREVLRVRPVDLARALELAEAEEWDELNDILPGKRAKAKKAPPPK